MSYTHDDLAKLKKAYARGVLRVREGESWIEYQSMKEMLVAIERIEAELGVKHTSSSPRGLSRVRFKSYR